MNNIPKSEHYVPKFYLKNFTENGKCPDLANILPLALLRIEIIKEWINSGRIEDINSKPLHR